MTKRLLLLQGANMEWLGLRQPEIYGTATADELDEMIRKEASARQIELEIVYTNVEGEAISAIYAAMRRGCDGVLLNPAGFLYAGYALRDCLRGISVPSVEIHMSNIEKRGMHSVTAEACVGYVAGFGIDSYVIALDAMIRQLNRTA